MLGSLRTSVRGMPGFHSSVHLRIERVAVVGSRLLPSLRPLPFLPFDCRCRGTLETGVCTDVLLVRGRSVQPGQFGRLSGTADPVQPDKARSKRVREAGGCPACTGGLPWFDGAQRGPDPVEAGHLGRTTGTEPPSIRDKSPVSPGHREGGKRPPASSLGRRSGVWLVHPLDPGGWKAEINQEAENGVARIGTAAGRGLPGSSTPEEGPTLGAGSPARSCARGRRRRRTRSTGTKNRARGAVTRLRQGAVQP